MLNTSTLSTGCNVTKVTIDDVSVDNNTVTVKFSSDPNARFRSRLNNQRFTTCECVINVIGINDKWEFVLYVICYISFMPLRITSESPVTYTYTGLTPRRYQLAIQAACPAWTMLL